jgi:hypothetical protein
VLTIFVAGLSVAGDLVTLINYFLGGDLTIRFLLKIAIVLLVAAGVLMHFIADIRGYWKEFPEKARYVGWGAGLLVLVTIASGFLIMGTPWQIRLYRFDDQKVSDLQNIQYQIVNYWQQKEKLPDPLTELQDPLSGWLMPLDPQTHTSYIYVPLGKMSFKLCATFNAETQQDSQYGTRPMMAQPSVPGEKGIDLSVMPWTHARGETCFTRTIDPARYPPYSKKTL